ncbi:MAG: hypothetical protein KF873_18125 [Gemmataceae bacterium]|nr:hypothetical protein [Gemmataceae bacterium]
MPVAPIASPPGLVPQTLTFQKPVEPTLPPMGIPAIPASTQKASSAELPALPVSTEKRPAEIAVPDVRTPVLTQNEPPAKPAETTPFEPRKDDVFRLDGDAVRNRRIQKELGDRMDEFPKPTPLVAPGTAYAAKTGNYPPVMAKVEPTYVIHRRLYFEEPNSERAGWDMGALQPIHSAYRFTRDCVFLPQNVASGFWKNRWDTSAGKCQPGAPTPYYLYPRGYTVSGMLWQVPLTVGLVFIFP